MSIAAWDHKYIGPKKKRRRVTPQMRALKARRDAGQKMSKPDETAKRVTHICNRIKQGTWAGRISITALAQEWCLSESRVEQLVAEARRTLKNG